MKQENRQEPEKAPPSSIPPTVVQPPVGHICILPAKPKPVFTPTSVKPAVAPPKSEPTLEQKVADEVERRLRDRGGNFVLGFIIGELLSCWWDKHHED